jgi:hypothetical protein
MNFRRCGDDRRAPFAPAVSARQAALHGCPPVRPMMVFSDPEWLPMQAAKRRLERGRDGDCGYAIT